MKNTLESNDPKIRERKLVLWFGIFWTGLVGSIALFDSFYPQPQGKSHWQGKFDGVFLLLACVGLVFKKKKMAQLAFGTFVIGRLILVIYTRVL